MDCHTAFVLQNGHDEYVRQFIDEAASLYRLQNDTFYIRTNNGCIPTSIYKEYHPLDESTYFSAVYSELKSEQPGYKVISGFRSADELAAYIKAQGVYGYKVVCAWGGTE